MVNPVPEFDPVNHEYLSDYIEECEAIGLPPYATGYTDNQAAKDSDTLPKHPYTYAVGDPIWIVHDDGTLGYYTIEQPNGDQ